MLGIFGGVALCLAAACTVWCKKKCKAPVAGTYDVAKHQSAFYRIRKIKKDGKDVTHVEWDISKVDGTKMGFEWNNYNEAPTAPEDINIMEGDNLPLLEGEKPSVPSLPKSHTGDSSVDDSEIQQEPHTGFLISQCIEFYSTSHKKWIPGKVIFCYSISHTYDIELAMSGQIRPCVEATCLRPAIHPKAPIEIYRDGTWEAVENTRAQRKAMKRIRLVPDDEVEVYEEREWLLAKVVDATAEDMVTVSIVTGAATRTADIYRGLVRLVGIPIIRRSVTKLDSEEADMCPKQRIMDRHTTSKLPLETWKRYSGMTPRLPTAKIKAVVAARLSLASSIATADEERNSRESDGESPARMSMNSDGDSRARMSMNSDGDSRARMSMSEEDDEAITKRRASVELAVKGEDDPWGFEGLKK